MSLDEQIIAARRQGLAVSEIAESLGVSIYRVTCALDAEPRRLRFRGDDFGTVGIGAHSLKFGSSARRVE